MPTFEVRAPDGVYSVVAPDEQSALDAFSGFHGGAHQQPAQSAPPQSPGIAEGMADAFANGIPVVGGLINKGVAALHSVDDYAKSIPYVGGALKAADSALGVTPTAGATYQSRLDKLNSMDQGFAAAHPALSAGAELAGGVASGVLVPGSSAANIAAKVGTDIAANAALGGANAATRGGSAIGGAITGGLLAGAGHAVAPIFGGAASQVGSFLKGHLAPEAAARGQLARAAVESGMSPADIEQSVQQAAAEGQPQFTVADAMGNAGQRLLSTVARANGEGRTAAVNALEGRQAGQGRRISNFIDQGFGTNGQTADQLRDTMTTARNDAADTAYSNVRDNAGQVDVVPAINNLDSNIGTGPGQAVRVANDSVESVLQPFRARLANVNPDDFAAVQRIRGDMADAAQSAQQSGYGNRARLIRQAIGQLDSSMEAASPGFRAANANFAQASRNIDAIDTGTTAANRGRTENTIPAFNALTPEGQAAFRTGYVDPLIAKVQGAASGVNKARDFTSDAFQNEAAAFAPGNDLMQRQLGREGTMYQTRNVATGGSRTADNLADQEAMGIDPALAVGAIGHLLHGNPLGALHALGNAGAAFLGNTAAVRAAVGRYLLENGNTLRGGALQDAINRTVAKVQRNARLANATRRAVTTAATTGINNATAPGDGMSTTVPDSQTQGDKWYLKP